jgi:hypothetical protein
MFKFNRGGAAPTPAGFSTKELQRIQRRCGEASHDCRAWPVPKYIKVKRRFTVSDSAILLAPQAFLYAKTKTPGPLAMIPLVILQGWFT